MTRSMQARAPGRALTALARAAGLASVVILTACPRSNTKTEPQTPSRALVPDADLVALLPDGAEVVVRVDLRRLRRFWRARPWSKQADAAKQVAARQLPGQLGGDLLSRADQLWLALWLPLDQPARLLLVARGPDTAGPGLAQWTRRAVAARGAARPSAKELAKDPRSNKGLAKDPRSKGRGRVAWQQYRGRPILEEAGEATALLTARTVTSGPATLVRQVVDLMQGVPNLASLREDREIMALLRLVAGDRAGKIPLLAVVGRLSAGIQQRLARWLRLPMAPHRLALRISGGSWLTIRLALDTQERKVALKLIKRLQGWVQGLARSTVVRKLRLTALLQLLAVHQEGARLWVQWAMPLAQFDPLARRLAPVLRLVWSLIGMPPASPARKQPPPPARPTP